MKKRLILVLGSVTVVVGASFFITGKMIQNTYYATVAQLNKDNTVNATIIDYNRGLFTSSAQIELAYKQNDQKVTLLQKITHGPLIAGSTPNGFKISMSACKVRTSLQNILENQLLVTTLVGFSNDATTWLQMNKLNDTSPSNLQVVVDPIHGEIKHDLKFTKFEGKISTPQILITTKDYQLGLADIAWERNYSQENMLEQFNIDSLVFIRNDIELVKFSGLQATAQIQAAANNLANLSFNANIERAKIVDQQFAQESITFTANNLKRDHMFGVPLVSVFSQQSIKQTVEELMANSAMSFEFPKNFSESLISYISFEMYRSSPIGVIDRRPAPEMLRDVSASIHSLLQDSLKKRLISDQGSHYALNFNLEPKAPS